MEVKFDRNNINKINVIIDNKVVKSISTPPKEFGCDVININEDDTHPYYIHNFIGYIIISDDKCRKIYHIGVEVDSMKKEQI